MTTPSIRHAAVPLPPPPAKEAPESEWNLYWGRCHGIINRTPEPEGARYKTHTISERDGQYFGDVQYEETAPAAPAPGAPPVDPEMEPEPEQVADAMHAAGEFSPAPEAARQEAGQSTGGQAPIEVLPPAKPKRQRASRAKGVPKPADAAAPPAPAAPAPTAQARSSAIPLGASTEMHQCMIGHVYTFPDGDMMCAVRPDFQNLQESPAGFGRTRVEAIKALEVEVNKRPPGAEEVGQAVKALVETGMSPREIGETVLEGVGAGVERGLSEHRAAVAPAGDHGERKHHKYSMSKLNHLDDCPGFTSREGSSEAADEGTALHEVVEAILQAWLEYNAAEERQITLVQAFEMALQHGLTLPPNAAGEAVSMTDGQRDAVRDVLKEIDWQIPGAVEIFVEERLPLVYPDGSELNYGHIDLVIGFPDRKCTVMDYKFGRGQVREASRNYQGFGYAISFLQAHMEYGMAKIVFVQPRISFKSEHTIIRSDIPGLFYRIDGLIRDAEDPNKRLRAGDQCRYCAVADRCPELANYVSRIGASYNDLPMPTTFHGTQITEPEHMALALFWAKRAEPAIEGIKKAAVEMAKSGLDLTCRLPSGATVSFELGDKAQSRELGSAPLIYQAVKDVLSPEEFTACVDVRLGDLETVYADSLQARLLADRGEKITKKDAVERLGAILTGEGLVSRPEGRTYYLKEKKSEALPVPTQQA